MACSSLPQDAYSENGKRVACSSWQDKGAMVARIPIKKVNRESLYLDRLPRNTRKAFLYCAELKFLARGDWYLAGGTALALQIGHRQSVGLDFFTPRFQF